VKNSLLIPYRQYPVPEHYRESAAIAAVNCSARPGDGPIDNRHRLVILLLEISFPASLLSHKLPLPEGEGQDDGVENQAVNQIRSPHPSPLPEGEGVCGTVVMS
jgi:hypothetical protein